jgi:hypothetical protein
MFEVVDRETLSHMRTLIQAKGTGTWPTYPCYSGERQGVSTFLALADWMSQYLQLYCVPVLTRFNGFATELHICSSP